MVSAVVPLKAWDAALFKVICGQKFVDFAEHPEPSQPPQRLRPNPRYRRRGHGTRGAGHHGGARHAGAWSLVHGYTALCIQAGLAGPKLRAGRAQLFARSVELLARSTP